MTPTLYFLRSSEQNIVSDMLHFSSRVDELGGSIENFTALEIYSKNYGLTSKDLGLYALVENKIAGAAWIRELKKEHNSNAYVDDTTPVLNVAVRPEFRGMGIGSAMLEQLFLEAGGLYSQISISVLNQERTLKYFKRLGFVILEDSKAESPVDSAEVITMIKILSDKAIERPSDGYDPRRWMD